MGFRPSESFERNCHSTQSRPSPCTPTPPPPPPALTLAARCGVYIKGCGRTLPPVNSDRPGRRKHARFANGIRKLHPREDPRHAGWVPDPGAGVPAGGAAAAAATAGCHGCRGPRHILRTTRIQLCPVCAPQTYHAHGESVSSLFFFFLLICCHFHSLGYSLDCLEMEQFMEKFPFLPFRNGRERCAPCVITHSRRPFLLFSRMGST